MIFFTLGTNPFQFERLARLADEFAVKTNEEVFIQTGYTRYMPKHCQFKKFLSKEEYINKISDSEVLVAHAGIGVCLDAKKYKKPLALMARLAKFNEHTDDHQSELVRLLVKQGRAIDLNERTSTEDAISDIENLKNIKTATLELSTREELICKLSEYINGLCG
jgi:UDP-N-acetylglucosamine transferase subunit ALG13